MCVRLDHSAPAPLSRHLIGHEVTKAAERGWARLENGDLLTAAEEAGFDVLVTSDKNMGYQQNLTGRALAIVVLGQGQWPALRPQVLVLDAINTTTPGSFTEVVIPRPPRRGSEPEKFQPQFSFFPLAHSGFPR